MGDNGLSGKKLVVDFYGPQVSIGVAQSRARMSIHLIASARSARDRLRDVSLSQPGSRLMLKWVGYRGSNLRTGF